MIHNLALDASIAFVGAFALLRILRPVGHHIGLVDRPGGRKSHHRPSPLVGGIAMFVAFAFATLLADVSLSSYWLLFAGALVLVVCGVLDDFRELSATQRFVAQIVAGLLMAWGAGVRLDGFGHLVSSHWDLSLGVLSLPVTLFATVGVINALNMCDGLDGLAASLTLVTIGGLATAAWAAGNTGALSILILLAAVVLAFVRFNLRLDGGALVFMGDAGSMFLGFVLAWFLIQLSQGHDRAIQPVTALWLFALPLFDTVSIMVRRMSLGRSPFAADREHFHHLLLAVGLSAKKALALILLLAVFAAAVGLAGQFLRVAVHWRFFGFLGLFAFYFWMISRSWRTKRFFNRSLALQSDSGC